MIKRSKSKEGTSINAKIAEEIKFSQTMNIQD